MKLSLWRVAEFMQGSGHFHGDSEVVGYSIDSRSIKPGEVFFAVKGERLDGHDYVAAALQRGAMAAVVAREQLSRFACQENLIAVDDTLAALQRLAAMVRCLWRHPVVGVTGSAGKTTTKECIAHVLAAKYRVLKSEGNLNNHFGMPLQLLKLEPEHEIAVIEMGMSHAGEIAALAKLSQPNTGVVTMVAPVHLEFFKSVAGIARAKYELIEALPRGGCAVLNSDDEYVSQFGRDFHGTVLMFGVKHPSDFRAENVQMLASGGSKFDLCFQKQRIPAEMPLIGEHNVYNALAAVAVGMHHGVPLQMAVDSLKTLQAADKRGQVVEIGGATVVNDCYNSNPKALNAMVDALAKMPAKRRIVVAGEMLELGAEGERLHRESGKHMAGRADFLLGVRGLAKSLVEGAQAADVIAEFVASAEEAGDWLAKNVRPGDAVLLKASRGVKLEKALERWKEKSGSSHQDMAKS
jgi:UDP-N-acetylmuramoyl-tripeptide--D-alanyl-D-alanine ligase